MRKLKLYLAELRLPFLTASILPVVLGATVAWHETGTLYWQYFILTLIGGMMLHSGANVVNDYFDHVSGCDEKNTDFVRPFTGGSRMIQKGLLTPREIFAEAMVCFAIGSFIGLYLAYTRGYPVLILGLIGVLSGYFYTGYPVRLVKWGIGETVVGLNFGILMTMGAYYVQVQQFSVSAFIASLPLATLIAAVLYINEFQDAQADRAVGKNHLVARLGKQRAAKLFIAVMLLPYVLIAVAWAAGIMPIYALLGFLSFPLSLIAAGTALKKYADSKALVPANAFTVLSHLFVGVLLIAGYIIDGGLR